MIRVAGFALALTLALGMPSVLAEVEAPTVTIFAAASLKTALDSISGMFKAQTGAELKISYAGSMALARQIEAGAPADVFFSADETSMDYLAGKKLIQPDTRTPLLGNKLVVVAPGTSQLENLPFTAAAFAAALGSGKLATGDMASVPLGRYARPALERLRLWPSLERKLAFTENARAALMFVARKEAPLGIVYLTDAKSEPAVKVVANIPPDAHPPIIYPVALTATATGGGSRQFLAFLKSKSAQAVFTQQGFTVLP